MTDLRYTALIWSRQLAEHQLFTEFFGALQALRAEQLGARDALTVPEDVQEQVENLHKAWMAIHQTLARGDRASVKRAMEASGELLAPSMNVLVFLHALQDHAFQLYPDKGLEEDELIHLTRALLQHMMEETDFVAAQLFTPDAVEDHPGLQAAFWQNHDHEVQEADEILPHVLDWIGRNLSLLPWTSIQHIKAGLRQVIGPTDPAAITSDDIRVLLPAALRAHEFREDKYASQEYL